MKTKKYLKKNSISQEKYNEIYNETFEHCKTIMCSKGAYDLNAIEVLTKLSVGMALKKAHLTVEKE